MRKIVIPLARLIFCAVLLLPFGLRAAAQETPGAKSSDGTPAYKNPDLPIEKRVDDLVSRMTLEEEASQMGYTSKPIPRLGIPYYNWWSEGLHGFGRAGQATVFPQAIRLVPYLRARPPLLSA